MITKFSSLYAGHIDLGDMGQDATPSRALHNLERTINQLVTEKRLLPQAPPLSLML